MAGHCVTHTATPTPTAPDPGNPTEVIVERPERCIYAVELRNYEPNRSYYIRGTQFSSRAGRVDLFAEWVTTNAAGYAITRDFRVIGGNFGQITISISPGPHWSQQMMSCQIYPR